MVVLMSIESLAAVVGDSDGSAFITKREFEDLKTSFNKEIEKYSNSMDNKIDGVISNYVNGLRVLRMREEKNLCYDENGIMSPRGNLIDLDWKEGIMSMQIIQNGGFFWTGDIGTQTNRADAYTQYKFAPLDPTEFTELSIQNVDYNQNNAEWRGRSKTYQYINGTDYDIVDSNYNSSNPNIIISWYNGLNAKSYPTTFTSMGHLMNWAAGPNYSDPSKRCAANAAYSAWKRIIRSTDVTNIICTPASATCGRFADFDNFYDWCNDDNPSGHSSPTYLSALFDSGTLREQAATTPSTRKMTYKTLDLSMNDTEKRSTAASKYWRPYFGFSKQVTNYNQLWTPKYDNLVKTLEEYDSNVGFAKDKENKRHLWIAAGAPVLEVKFEDKVTIVCEFSDSQVHDVWFKIGPFTKGTNVNEDDCIPRASIYQGNASSTTLATAGSMSKAVRVNSGTKTTFTIDVPKKGILFMKWSIYGNSGAGGGTFLPPEKVILSRA